MTYSRLANIRETRAVLERFGLATKHRLGQNFLVNDEVIGRIVEDRAGVIAACYVLDRGEDADPMGLGVPPQAHAPAPVVPVRLP